MPVLDIEYSRVSQRLQSPQTETPTLISTPDGIAILEIQGELTLPAEVPQGTSEAERYTLDAEGKDIVKFGRLELDGSTATLFIGTSQRLVGAVVKLNPPLCMLKFPEPAERGDIPIAGEVLFVDVVTHKIIFKQRPLPIM